MRDLSGLLRRPAGSCAPLCLRVSVCSSCPSC